MRGQTHSLFRAFALSFSLLRNLAQIYMKGLAPKTTGCLVSQFQPIYSDVLHWVRLDNQEFPKLASLHSLFPKSKPTNTFFLRVYQGYLRVLFSFMTLSQHRPLTFKHQKKLSNFTQALTDLVQQLRKKKSLFCFLPYNIFLMCCGMFLFWLNALDR